MARSTKAFSTTWDKKKASAACVAKMVRSTMDSGRMTGARAMVLSSLTAASSKGSGFEEVLMVRARFTSGMVITLKDITMTIRSVAQASIAGRTARKRQAIISKVRSMGGIDCREEENSGICFMRKVKLS